MPYGSYYLTGFVYERPLARLRQDLAQFGIERADDEIEPALGEQLAYLEASGWELWMQTLCRAKAIYGKGVLKVFWNNEDRRPDVKVVENLAEGVVVNRITVDSETAEWAKVALERMLAIV